jgi:hypothetical protein
MFVEAIRPDVDRFFGDPAACLVPISSEPQSASMAMRLTRHVAGQVDEFENAAAGASRPQPRHHEDGGHLGNISRRARRAPPAGAAMSSWCRPPDEIMSYTQTARPGSRGPHGWIDEGQSTLDLFGNGFTLLCFDSRSRIHATFLEAARRRGVPLRAVEIAERQIAQLYERALVLVRPDGHVAWRADEVTSVQAEQVLARASGLDTEHLATTGSVN